MEVWISISPESAVPHMAQVPEETLAGRDLKGYRAEVEKCRGLWKVTWYKETWLPRSQSQVSVAGRQGRGAAQEKG